MRSTILLAAVALVGVSLLPVPSANAGTRVSINIGTGYSTYPYPVYYQARPCYARPVYRPYYYKPNPYYSRNNGYYYNRGAVYYNRPVRYYR